MAPNGVSVLLNVEISLKVSCIGSSLLFLSAIFFSFTAFLFSFAIHPLFGTSLQTGLLATRTPHMYMIAYFIRINYIVVVLIFQQTAVFKACGFKIQVIVTRWIHIENLIIPN